MNALVPWRAQFFPRGSPALNRPFRRPPNLFSPMPEPGFLDDTSFGGLSRASISSSPQHRRRVIRHGSRICVRAIYSDRSRIAATRNRESRGLVVPNCSEGKRGNGRSMTTQIANERVLARLRGFEPPTSGSGGDASGFGLVCFQQASLDYSRFVW
jgi:hypothetical protein